MEHKPWIRLERDLWIFTDGKLYWFDSACDATVAATFAGSGNFPREINKATSTERKWWLAAIEEWQANHDSDRAIGSPLYQKASEYAAHIKSVGFNRLGEAHNDHN